MPGASDAYVTAFRSWLQRSAGGGPFGPQNAEWLKVSDMRTSFVFSPLNLELPSLVANPAAPLPLVLSEWWCLAPSCSVLPSAADALLLKAPPLQSQALPGQKKASRAAQRNTCSSFSPPAARNFDHECALLPGLTRLWLHNILRGRGRGRGVRRCLTGTKATRSTATPAGLLWH